MRLVRRLVLGKTHVAINAEHRFLRLERRNVFFPVTNISALPVSKTGSSVECPLWGKLKDAGERQVVAECRQTSIDKHI
jgi:hypothetical protein